MKKARALQKELSNELLKLEKTQQQQAENEALLKELNHQVEEVKNVFYRIDDRREQLKSDSSKLEMEKTELEQEIEMKKKQEKDKLIPEIERYRKLISEAHLAIKQNDIQIEKESQKSVELTSKIEELDTKKEELKEEFEGL